MRSFEGYLYKNPIPTGNGKITKSLAMRKRKENTMKRTQDKRKLFRLTMQELEARSLNEKISNRNQKYHHGNALLLNKKKPKTNSAGKLEKIPTTRELLEITADTMNLEDELQEIYNSQTKHQTEIYHSTATMITLVTLKLLKNGHKIIDKNTGKQKIDSTGNPLWTPPNMEAANLLRKGKNDTSGMLEDLISEVKIAIYQAVHDGYIIFTEKTLQNGKTINNALQPTETAPNSIVRDIMNVVQKTLYQDKQKHYKHRYDPRATSGEYDQDGNETEAYSEDYTMYTMAQYEYDKSIDSLDYREDGIPHGLHIKLTDNERIVLSARLQRKQVQRSYSDNGITKYRYVSRRLTNNEVAEATSLSIQTVKTCLNNIKLKCIDWLDGGINIQKLFSNNLT